MSAQAQPESSELETMAKQYLEWMLQIHSSECTVDVRRRYLRYFFDWCELRGLDRPGDISRTIMEAYQRHLYKYRKKDGHPLAIASQAKRLQSIGAYFKYLSKRHYIEYNPCADLQMPRQDIRLPRQYLSADEVEQIMIQPDLCQPEEIRNRAILELFYSTGIRRMELVQLGIYDIDPIKKIVFIKKGKGRKDRIIPISDRALQWINKYLNEVRDKFLISVHENTLFLSIHGDQLSECYVTGFCGEYIKKSSVNKQGSCHIFRHTMATLMHDNGADIRYIQQMLGHADIKTTQIYTQVSIKQLQSVYELTHPVNRPHKSNSQKSKDSKLEEPPQKPEDSS